MDQQQFLWSRSNVSFWGTEIGGGLFQKLCLNHAFSQKAGSLRVLKLSKLSSLIPTLKSLHQVRTEEGLDQLSRLQLPAVTVVNSREPIFEL